MEKPKCFISFHDLLLAFTLMGIGVDGGSRCHGHSGAPFQRLFVFGDSYLDTGNLGKLGRNLTRSWYEPYGTTFPHRPTGRFSDGRLLTDYFDILPPSSHWPLKIDGSISAAGSHSPRTRPPSNDPLLARGHRPATLPSRVATVRRRSPHTASFMGIKSPIPYKYRRIGSKLLPYGMNFAVGGSGVFDTEYHQKNLSLQIDAFKGQIDEGFFSKCDLNSSVALVSAAGNDYAQYLATSGTMDLWAFRKRLIKQLKSDLKRLNYIGVRKVVVNTVHTLGCNPFFTRGSNYTECSVLYNKAAEQHNTQLEAAVKELNAANPFGFLFLDQYRAFNATIHQEKGARKFENTLKPCCDGKTNDTYCGNINEKGVKQYSLCCSPEDFFYWYNAHPTQTAWGAIFELLKPSLYKFLL